MTDFETLPVVEAGCRMPTARTIAQSDAYCRSAAEMGSQNLLLAMLRYGAKHGLPNIDPDECFRRLVVICG